MTMERRAWTIALLTTVLLVVVSLRVIYWQMLRGDDLSPVAVNLVQAAGEYSGGEAGDPGERRSAIEFLTGVSTVKELQSLPQPVIQRTKNFLQNIKRGAIYDRNGRQLAFDIPASDGESSRFYSEPSLAHTIGYVSGLRTGVTGLELLYNATLLGLDRPDAQVELMLNKPVIGSDLILTIDSYVQRAAENALQGRAGAILVLDARSGAIIALASAPRFDPNRVLDEAYVNNLVSSCGSNPSCQAPFLNRASQALYPPGSTWKTVTLIAALDSGQVSPDTKFDFGELVVDGDRRYYVYEVDGHKIIDPNHAEQQLSLEMSYAKSANAAFARIGNEILPDVLEKYANRFGFGAPGNTLIVPADIETAPSQLAQDPRSLYDNNLLRSVTAIGQGELLASPLSIGMVVLSVLNEGRLPIPYLVQAIREPGGGVAENLPNRRTLENLMQPGTAQQVRQMMVSVVQKGSGQKAQIPGLIVGGKTGTAQVSGDLQPHSWFAGFAQKEKAGAETAGVVVVVVLENAGEGSQIAAPIFAEVAAVAMSHQGEPVAEIVATPTPAPTATSTPPPPEIPTQLPPEVQSTEVSIPTIMPPVIGTPPPTGFLLPPDIVRNPDRKDITSADPSCADLRDMPEATGQFIWPSAYQALSGGDFKEGHPGFDLAAPSGSRVNAADTGLVLFAGWTGSLGYGNAILIDHGNGYQTLYAHLSQVSVVCGTKVEKGQLIGLSGNTGNSTGPHLHFEVRVPGGYVNPIKVLPLP